MSTNQPTNNDVPPPDWRELRDQERAQRHAARDQMRAERHMAGDQYGWLVGIVLIALGILFLFQNMGLFAFRNWWALFILIPAAGAFATAWGIFQKSGGVITPAVTGPLVGGFVLLAVTLAFLFDLNWSLIGPGLLILLGIGALLGAFTWHR